MSVLGEDLTVVVKREEWESRLAVDDWHLPLLSLMSQTPAL